MIRIDIKNFQSISHLELEFEGFATIVGRNFIGKSATLRAINAALTNRSGTKFIRWGEKFCEVRITTSEYDILWHKEDSNNYYEITVGDGKKEKFDKIGKEEPPALLKELGFSVIKLGTEKVNLNYAEQFFPLFLVDRQDTKGADLLTYVYGLDVIYKAVELCGKEQRSNKDDLKIRKKDLESINKDLEKFWGFDKAIEKGKVLKESRKSIGQAQNVIVKLTRLESDIRKIYAECNRLKGISDITLPESDMIISELEVLNILKQKSIKIGVLEKSVNNLEGVSNLAIPESSELDLGINLMVTLKSKYSRITSLSSEVKRLEGIDSISIPDVKDLSQDIFDIRSLKSLLAKITSIQQSLDKYSSLSEIILPVLEIDIAEIENLNSKKNELKQLSLDIKNIEAEITDIIAEQKKVEEELSSFGACPLCGVSNG